MLELRLPSISGSSRSKCAHLPDVLAVYEREDCDVDHVPAVLVVVLHLVQGQGYHRVTVVAAEVVLDKDIVGIERKRNSSSDLEGGKKVGI